MCCSISQISSQLLKINFHHLTLGNFYPLTIFGTYFLLIAFLGLSFSCTIKYDSNISFTFSFRFTCRKMFSIPCSSHSQSAILQNSFLKSRWTLRKKSSQKSILIAYLDPTISLFQSSKKWGKYGLIPDITHEHVRYCVH